MLAPAGGYNLWNLDSSGAPAPIQLWSSKLSFVDFKLSLIIFDETSHGGRVASVKTGDTAAMCLSTEATKD